MRSCPRSQSLSVVGLGFEPRPSKSRILALNDSTCLPDSNHILPYQRKTLPCLLPWPSRPSAILSLPTSAAVSPSHAIHTSQDTLLPGCCVCCSLSFECPSPPLGLEQGLAHTSPPPEALPDLLTHHSSRLQPGQLSLPPGPPAPGCWSILHVLE